MNEKFIQQRSFRGGCGAAIFGLAILFGPASSGLKAQNGIADSVFSKVPFDRWMAEGDQTHFRWVIRVPAPVLSNHQRLRERIEIQVDGSELLKRRGKSQLVGLVQINDSSGRVYQSHGAMTLGDVKAEEARTVDVIYSQEAFVVPGDYAVSLVLFDTTTGEHNVAKRSLHVAPIHNDPLEDAWSDLPTVEFVPSVDPPDLWFGPQVTGRLRLPLETRRPVDVDVLVNASPSESAETTRQKTGSTATLSTILPALKVLSQLQVRNGNLNVAVLDLSRRSVSFKQDGVHELDWPGLKAGLAEASPNLIDVHSLERREENAQFFVTEVSRRWTDATDSTKRMRVLIVLSPPMAFASGEDLHRIKAAKDPSQRIFYIRYRAERPHTLLPPEADPRLGQREGMSRGLPRPAAYEVQQDSLEGTLKPLDPRLFDVETPEQFRRALSVILGEISRM